MLYADALNCDKILRVRSKEIEASDPFICNDSYESESSNDEEDTKDDRSRSGDKVTTDNDVERDKVLSDDPFNLYDILNKRKDSGDDLKYPPSFTPSVINMEEVNKKVKRATSNEETKMESMELVTIKMLRGNASFDYALSSSLGNSGDRWDGDCVIMGDFNEGRTKQERYGSTFNVQAHKTANKMSKFDRFLVSKGLLASFPYLLALCLDRNLLDHHPILMQELSIDYGPTPFRFFHSWLTWMAFEKMLAIRGTLVDGEWIVDPLDVKSMLSLEQQADLERNVSNEEIKSVVWDCGMNKSPGPDGFTFDFFRRYWMLLEHDIVATHKDFFCFSDVQSTFTSNRQILDGPFILNELLSWCKYKKFKTMVFKVDFEKAFNFIQWDYLQDILKMFGFGDKWCGWINGCLNSAMGSVLINGSLTSEFQFYKGLKQEDPLSPFLFTLIMKSLHLSFSKVTDAGLFSGIPIDSSLTLSHIFFVDDDIFVGPEEVDILYRVDGGDFYEICDDLRFIKAIYGEDGALNSPSSLSKRSPWLDIIREDPWLDDLALKHKFLRLYALDNYKQISVVEKINHTSMVDTFCRPPRGGAEEEQLGFLLSRMDDLTLTNIPDCWVWSLDKLPIDDSILSKEKVATRWVKVMSIDINVLCIESSFR
ncbi:RNA-directed DNA polymerase, eukaryota [Tanacetum coccineum]